MIRIVTICDLICETHNSGASHVKEIRRQLNTKKFSEDVDIFSIRLVYRDGEKIQYPPCTLTCGIALEYLFVSHKQ